MEELPDKEIVIRIKRGEIEYFSHIVNRYTSIILNYINSKLFDKTEVDDIVQNIFLKFYKAIDGFDESRPVLPYIFEIAKNEMKMYFRSRKKTVQLDERIAVADQKDFPVEEDNIDELLQFVNEDQRKALKLLLDGYSYKEISKEINKPLNTIRTLIRRARLKISASQRMKKYEKT
ncbi:MAG: RNA polymerase sigma factor [Candidatus Roizmanbacteria bacterium]|nr:MAG: RNA polymerase sigma factor [Candidatus Roizmanbacteria bacterium]